MIIFIKISTYLVMANPKNIIFPNQLFYQYQLLILDFIKSFNDTEVNEHSQNCLLLRLFIFIRTLWQYNHWYGSDHSLLCCCHRPCRDFILFHIFCQSLGISNRRIPYQSSNSALLHTYYINGNLTYWRFGIDRIIIVT